MLPRLVDGGSHIVSQDDELRRPAVVMAAKSYDLDFGTAGFIAAFVQCAGLTGFSCM